MKAINTNFITEIQTVGDLIKALGDFPKDSPIIYHTGRGYARKGKISVNYGREMLTEIACNRETRELYDRHYGALTGIIVEVSEDYSDVNNYPAIELNRPFTLWAHNCGKPAEDFEQGIKKCDEDGDYLPENEWEPYILISKRAYWPYPNNEHWDYWRYYSMTEKQ